ncbi:FecR/PupR family sigma factor regulator [Methylorubrum suomiense]
MNDGVPLEADRAALQSWLTSDERHAVAYAEVGRLWDGAMGMSLSKPQRVRPWSADAPSGRRPWGLVSAWLAGCL